MAISGMQDKMLVRNELLESDRMFVLREHREKNLSDVTVSRCRVHTSPQQSGTACCLWETTIPSH